MGTITRILRHAKKPPRDEMFSKITPLEACTLIEDILRLGDADALLKSVSDRTVAQSWLDREDGYLELRSIRARIATLLRRANERLRKDFLT